MARNPETRLGAVEDELAIRALAARFSDCANERDYAGFADIRPARAVWETGPPMPARAQGVDDIVALLRRLLEPQVMFMQMTHSGVVHTKGDTATAHFVEREREHERGEISHFENLAVYDDMLIREADGVWRHARRYRYRFLDDTAFAGRVFPLTAGPGGVGH